MNKYDLPDRALGDLSGQANVQKSTNHENMEFRLYPMLFFCESVGESTRKHPPDQSRLAGCLEMSNKHKYINTANVVSVGSPASAWANQIDGIEEAGAPLTPPTTKKHMVRVSAHSMDLDENTGLRSARDVWTHS